MLLLICEIRLLHSNGFMGLLLVYKKLQIFDFIIFDFIFYFYGFFKDGVLRKKYIKALQIFITKVNF